MGLYSYGGASWACIRMDCVGPAWAPDMPRSALPDTTQSASLRRLWAQLGLTAQCRVEVMVQIKLTGEVWLGLGLGLTLG